ncbi:MAG: amidase [Thermoleophilaceae bacterium]
MTVGAPSRPLTTRSATELARAIGEREITAREAVEAHIELLERVQPRMNALAAERFDAARDEADAADARVASGEIDLPPLLGVPCTIKESIALAGMPNCAGVVSRRDHRCAETAPSAQRLLDAGAIPLGVTNTSELCMWIECENRVYGRTRNAYDPSRIAGGSSGGEGAAVGSGGSPIGLGSDIGGSIRLPAFFNGVFGHKPSPGLVSNEAMYPNTDGEAERLLAVGPLTRRAEDLMPALRAVAERDVAPLEAAPIEGMPVLVSLPPGRAPASRDLLGARERAAGALAAFGAQVERSPIRSLHRALDLYLAALSDGAGTSVRAVLEQAGSAPPSLWAGLRRGGPHTVATRLLLGVEGLNSRIPQGRTRRAIAAGRSLAEELIAAIGDGVLLHPPFARVAPRHGRTVGRPWLIAHMAIFNLAGLPVTQVPLGLDRRGLPLGVQVVAAPGNDHVTIATAIALERALGGWVPPPRR